MIQKKWANFCASLEDWFKISGFLFVFCGFWMFSPAFIIVGAVYLCIAKPFFFVPCVLLYLAWFRYTKEWPEMGGMPWYWFRTHVYFMSWGGDYFNYRIVKTAELPSDRNYIVGSHPHGMVCFGMIMSFASYMAGITDLYKGLKMWGVTLSGQFNWPLRRELLMLGGGGAATRRNLEWILRQKEKGQAISVVAGGLNEALMSAPGKYHLKMKDRKGFIKMAINEGADLVPMFHFGENETYKPVTGICPKRLRNMQAHVMKDVGFCMPSLMGRSLIGLPWGGLVPLQTRLVTVIGGPIHVDRNPNPTQEEVDHLHTVYCEKLIELFESHKGNYGIRPEQRII
ncbi:hypothetical protein PMAYCL1PPCAC_15286, partial [Pristionchus mayeri]